MYQFKKACLIIDKLNRCALLKRKVDFYILLILVIMLSITGFTSGLSRFSPDSWSYYELSRTVFSDEFYKFNTYRSYYTETYSASFPFGYPIILALCNYVFGYDPFTAVVVNVIAALLTWFVVVNIVERLKFTALSCIAISSSFVLHAPYLDEIFSGRSIPVALLLFAFSVKYFLSGRLVACGIFLGLSALVRFDYLLYALLFQLLTIFICSLRVKSIVSMGSGFFVGIFPWIIFSWINFGKLWVSDNSWVVLSSFPSFVTDYPAVSNVTIFEDPLLWFQRVSGNLIPWSVSMIRGALRFPLLIFSILLYFIFHRESKKNSMYSRTILTVFAITLSFSPFLLTGYFDIRYFTLSFILLSGTLIYQIESLSLSVLRVRFHFHLISLSILLTFLFGCIYMYKSGEEWKSRYGKPDPEISLLKQLEICHLLYPEITFIFDGNARLAARYGAITGNRTAFLPANFNALTSANKMDYFARMKPFMIIDKDLNIDQCHITPVENRETRRHNSDYK